MPYSNYTESLLDLKDVIVTNIRTDGSVRLICLEQKRMPHICPSCGTETDRIHDYREQPIKDIPSLGKHTVLMFRKRRYSCQGCGKRIPEKTSFLSRYQRMTGRMQQYIISRFSQSRSAQSIASECGCSLTTAIRMFDRVSYPLPSLPPAISIDEFKGNAGGHKFQCILTNPKKRRLLDILESRSLESLCTYFNQFDMGQKNSVQYIVMDMSGEFRSMAKAVFPKAKIVADKFHVCRQVTWAFERTRIKAQKEFGPERRKYFKRSRWIMLKRKKNLTVEEKQQLEVMLSLSEEIRNAYLLKEKFYEFMDSENWETARRNLKEWNLYAGIINLPEFNKAVNTFCNWSTEILEAFRTGFTNGYTEGMNNKTKVLKRACYGVKNFGRFRNRLLYMANAH